MIQECVFFFISVHKMRLLIHPSRVYYKNIQNISDAQNRFHFLDGSRSHFLNYDLKFTIECYKTEAVMLSSNQIVVFIYKIIIDETRTHNVMSAATSFLHISLNQFIANNNRFNDWRNKNTFQSNKMERAIFKCFSHESE